MQKPRRIPRKKPLQLKPTRGPSITLVGEKDRYVIYPVALTGRTFVFRYKGAELQFEIGKEGYLSKSGQRWLSKECYDLVYNLAVILMRTSFNGYRRGQDTSAIAQQRQQPTLPLFTSLTTR